MKLIISILNDNDSDTASQALIEHGFRVTRIASTGGFFRRGKTTLMIGVEDKDVEKVIEVIRNSFPPEIDPAVRKATIFVLQAEDYRQI